MQEPGRWRGRTGTAPDAKNYPSVVHTCEELGAITESVQSPARIYAASFYTWLHESTYQWLIALVGAFIGVCCVWDGAGVWEALFTAGVAAMAAGITRYEAEHWDLAASQITKAGLMLQAAIAVAVAVHGGFEGFQVLFGFLVGVLGAHNWNDWAGDFESWMPGHTLLWHTMGAIVGVMVLTMWRKPVLSTLAPLFGGLLATSGAGCLASYTWAALSGAGSVGAFLPPPETPWYAAAVDLLGGGGLVVHCICAVCALVLHSYSAERRIPAIICLILCILVTMVTSALCGDATRGLRCPSWIAESRGWLWRTLGCCVWALITAAAAWRQLGLLQDWGAHRFWKGYFDKAARRFRYMELPEAEQESPREASMYPGEGNVSSRSFREPPNRVLVQDLQDSYRHRPRRHHHNSHAHHHNDANPNSSAAPHPDGAP